MPVSLKWFRLIIFGLSILIWVSACGLGADESVTTPQMTPYPLALEAISSQLNQFDSYEVEYILDFDGTRSGQTASGEITSQMAVDQQAEMLQVSIIVAGNVPNVEYKGSVSKFFRIDNKVYLQQLGQVTWFEQMPGTEISPQDVGFFDLSRLVALPRTSSNPTETVSIDGATVTKINFTEQDLNDPNIIFERASGTIWFAKPENIVRKYELSATLRFLTPVPQAHILDEGWVNLSYELTDLNSNLEITPPYDSHQSLLASLPRPDDAEITAVYPTLLEYTSAISPVSATLFYQNELTPLGWTQVITTVFEEKARLAFTKDDQTATILINPDQSDRVKLVLSLE